jgi:phospholipid/cholesterol/gamma-HCH transport system substrate-binding protein
METKSNNILVGMVTLLLLAVAAGFVVWLSGRGEGKKKEYDIFFQQSVNGLNKGSSVTFSGVPVGQIQDVKIWKPDPDFVRVRISIDGDTAIRQGTTATISGVGFTGVSEIQLDGGIKGAPRISCPKENPKSVCPAGKPVIPTKPGALGELLNSAPLLLERLSTLTERLTNILSDNNQQSIEKTLDNVETLSGALATQTAPELQAAIAEARGMLSRAGAAADSLGATSASANALINDQGKPLIADLRKTLEVANGSLKAIEASVGGVDPAFKQLNDKTLPEIQELTRDLRRLSASLKDVTEKIEQEGVTGLVSTPKLPDYKAEKK